MRYQKIKTLPIRAWRKFARIPGIDTAVTIGNENLKSLLFWVDANGRTETMQTYQNCQNIEDYYTFSRQVFGPHQIKSEIIGFLEFARLEKPEVVCEIGTADGGTNFLLSQSLPTVEQMIGVDLYVKNKSKLHYFSRPNQIKRFISASSYDKTTIKKVEVALDGRTIDLLFIDGDHTYEGVKKDFLSYRRFVREGGLIIFHDIVPDYLTRFGKPTGRWVGDVPRFWNEIKSYYPVHEFVEHPDQDGLGIGVIQYSDSVLLPEDFEVIW